MVVSSIVVVVVVVQIAMINAKLHVPKMVPQGEIDVLGLVACQGVCTNASPTCSQILVSPMFVTWYYKSELGVVLINPTFGIISIFIQ